jgi:hypothetical protein
MTQQTYRIQSNVALPKGVKLSKRTVKQPTVSEYEVLPLTQMSLGDSFVARGYNARALRGIIHKRSRTGSMRFVSRTTLNGRSARVWRVK